MSAMRYNAHFKIYYERKLKEGKNKFTIFNAMKNKLVRLIFSLAKQGKKYDENYTYSLVWIIEIPCGDIANKDLIRLRRWFPIKQ